MPVCRNPPPDFLLYRRRDARTACALNQDLRSLSLTPEWFSSFPLVEGLNKDEWERGDYRSWKALMAEREGIEPTKDHNSPSTVLKTAAATRHASLSVASDGSLGLGDVNEEMLGFLLENQGCNPVAFKTS